MQIERLLAHHGLTSNPFVAEEARHDPVFEQLQNQTMPHHPDFDKILGRIAQPNTSIVFGEKGSGKTAIRLLIGKRVQQHNQDHPDQRTLLVPYDNLNPFLDRILRRQEEATQSRWTRKQPDTSQLLENFRLEDHQDAILSLAVTRLIDAMQNEPTFDTEPMILPEDWVRRLRKQPRHQRVELLRLALLYDQPRSGNVRDRLARLRKQLKLGWRAPIAWSRIGAMLLTAISLTGAGVLGLGHLFGNAVPFWAQPWFAGGVGIVAAMAWLIWFKGYVKRSQLAKKIHLQTPAIERSVSQLKVLLAQLPRAAMDSHVWPVHDTGDTKNSRYELTAKWIDLLNVLGYTGMMVLVDRVDEPTAIEAQPERMQAIIWPMLDNKFLQQQGIGLKLLLPLELRYILHRQSPAFYQEARLDKQHLVDQLRWSGATLFDLCTSRLRACRKTSDTDPLYLTDLFESNVSRDMLVDALDQMHQPRDAFKFLYSVIQDHCRMVPEDDAKPLIARITLETVRRNQSQRVQELHRGLSPA